MADDRSNEMLEKIENGIKETMNSESYKAFLKFQSSFHSYSFNNQMLIYMQNPHARQVAGFEAWKKLGRFVNANEKSLKILAPAKFHKEYYVDKLDPKTNKPMIDPNTNSPIQIKKFSNPYAFKVVSVFDVSQTGGKELPEICKTITTESANSKNILKALENISEFPVVYESIKGGARGYFSRDEKKIAVEESLGLDHKVKTLVHEVAHSRLHSDEISASLDRMTKEVQAESVAFIVSERFGIDTSQYSFEYLANWSSGKELPELKSSFTLIQKTATEIINKIEEQFELGMDLNKRYELREYYIGTELNDKLIKLEEMKISLVIENGEMIVPLEAKNILSIDDIKAIGKYYDVKPISEVQEVVLSPFKASDIKALYSSEYKSINHLSSTSLETIATVNTLHGKQLPIKEIKKIYEELGKNMTNNPSSHDVEQFEKLDALNGDLKKAQIAQRNETISQSKPSMEVVRVDFQM